VSADAAIAAEILRQLGQRAAVSSICPSEVARALAPGDEAAWRALMPQVREVAAHLRDEGRVRITRGGADLAAPDDLHRGAIRLARGPSFASPGPPPPR
jgi:Protein of unknown function (DUF3253)